MNFYDKVLTIFLTIIWQLFDDFDFCIPKFVHGNGLNINICDTMLLYDRIYVGAGIANEHSAFIKGLLKINGILIMPLNDCVIFFVILID